jgi:alcohol dehydrogenase
MKATICGTDLHILKGDVSTCQPGRILGHEGVGIVDTVGSAVTEFKPGDRVLISCISACDKCLFCRKQMFSHCHFGDAVIRHRRHRYTLSLASTSGRTIWRGKRHQSRRS